MFILLLTTTISTHTPRFTPTLMQINVQLGTLLKGSHISTPNDTTKMLDIYQCFHLFIFLINVMDTNLLTF